MATDDQPQPTPSGSRGEPAADGGGTPADPPAAEQPGPDDPTTSYPTAGPAPETPEAPDGPAQAEPTRIPLRERRMIGIPVASAVAAGLVVASGLGGYALGSFSSGDGLAPMMSDGTGGQRGRLPGDGDFDHDGDGHGFRGGPGGPGGYGMAPPGLDGGADQRVPPDLDGDTDGGADGSADEGTGATT